jgi:hypothetical protein
MNGRTVRTPAIRAKFLELLGESGNVAATCAALGLHRPVIYAWRHADPAFARDWDNALQLGSEAIEDEARRRAMAGSDYLLVFLLKGLKPEKYKQNSSVDLNQNVSYHLRNLPIDELRRRLDQLRREQDYAPLALSLPDSGDVA